MRIFVNESQVSAFRQSWPCSGLPDDSSITFEFATNGNLLDVEFGNGEEVWKYDSSALVALSQDAQNRLTGSIVCDACGFPTCRGCVYPLT